MGFSELFKNKCLGSFVNDPYIKSSCYRRGEQIILVKSLDKSRDFDIFDTSEKEVNDLHTRISEGMREAKKNRTQIKIAVINTRERSHLYKVTR